MTPSRLLSSALTLLLSIALLQLASTDEAQAGKADQISKTFKGQIIMSEDALPDPDPSDAKGTIKAYKSQQLKSVTGTVTEGVATFRFHFTAFFKAKPNSSSLTLEFYTDDKEKLFVADKRLNGADPKLKILTSEVVISEDENLNRNRKYLLKLVSSNGKKTVVLATTKFATK